MCKLLRPTPTHVLPQLTCFSARADYDCALNDYVITMSASIMHKLITSVVNMMSGGVDSLASRLHRFYIQLASCCRHFHLYSHLSETDTYNVVSLIHLQSSYLFIVIFAATYASASEAPATAAACCSGVPPFFFV